MTAARTIVMCIDDSEGVWWELRHIVEKRHAHKTVFLLHPKHGAPDAARQLLDKMASIGGPVIRLPPGLAGGGVVGFVMGRNGALRLFTSKRVSRASYVVALRQYLRLDRTAHGERRAPSLVGDVAT